MSSEKKNLSDYDAAQVPSAANMRFGLVVSEFNREITEALYQGAERALRQMGCTTENIIRIDVPGSFELTLGASWMAEFLKPDAVICFGCVIQGQTRHFEFICDSVSKGIMDLNLKFSIPFIFGVLTTDTLEQAHERAGGKFGNKGTESAIAAIKMAALHRQLLTNNHLPDKPAAPDIHSY